MTSDTACRRLPRPYVFGVQEEVSQKIAIALKVILAAEEEAARA